MRYSYDTEAEALYLTLQDGIVARSQVLPEANLVVDFDSQGRPLGLEVIHPERPWPLADIFSVVGEEWKSLVREALGILGISEENAYPSRLGTTGRSLATT